MVRFGPAARSLATSKVHLSPIICSAPAMGQPSILRRRTIYTPNLYRKLLVADGWLVPIHQRTLTVCVTREHHKLTVAIGLLHDSDFASSRVIATVFYRHLILAQQFEPDGVLSTKPA